MNENYSLKELNEWADKMIDCISKWANEMNKAFNGSPTSIKIEKLDFSEHDKVFEDKIAELKKDYNTVSELLCKYQHENEGLKKRIAELESKESEKTMRIEFHADNGEMLTPLEVASSLINQNTFKVDELRELSEFLQVYCRHHNDRDTETISF